MEPRLVPVNALIALLTGQGGWPALLGDQGFRFAWLEVPVKTSRSQVVVDVVALDDKASRAMVAESKSGGSIDAKQAAKYAAMTTTELRRMVTFPADPHAARLEVVFACLADHETAITEQLHAPSLDLHPSLLIVDTAGARVALRPGPGSSLSAFDEAVPGGLPPGLIRLDADSPDDVFDPAGALPVQLLLQRPFRPGSEGHGSVAGGGPAPPRRLRAATGWSGRRSRPGPGGTALPARFRSQRRDPGLAAPPARRRRPEPAAIAPREPGPAVLG
ncbi:MAG: hypothetical protein ACYC1D_05410 [Acidimicrobiales bacterium]